MTYDPYYAILCLDPVVLRVAYVDVRLNGEDYGVEDEHRSVQFQSDPATQRTGIPTLLLFQEVQAHCLQAVHEVDLGIPRRRHPKSYSLLRGPSN